MELFLRTIELSTLRWRVFSATVSTRRWSSPLSSRPPRRPTRIEFRLILVLRYRKRNDVAAVKYRKNQTKKKRTRDTEYRVEKKIAQIFRKISRARHARGQNFLKFDRRSRIQSENKITGGLVVENRARKLVGARVEGSRNARNTAGATGHVATNIFENQNSGANTSRSYSSPRKQRDPVRKRSRDRMKKTSASGRELNQNVLASLTSGRKIFGKTKTILYGGSPSRSRPLQFLLARLSLEEKYLFLPR